MVFDFFFLLPVLFVAVLFVEDVPFVALLVVDGVVLSDWSPVEVLALLLSDWSPVVVVELLLSDWSPVLVVLSMVSEERPRRSMLGEKVEVEPVTDDVVSEVEPVIDELTLELDPVTDGLEAVLAVFAEALLVPAAVEFVDEPLMPDAVELVDAEPLMPEVLAWESGMQSMCTGLCECSFACPVSLSASLPACGWPRLLHSGLEASAVAVEFVELFAVEFVALELVEDFGDVEFVELETCGLVALWPAALLLATSLASACPVAPKMAEIARALRYWERVIAFASCESLS